MPLSLQAADGLTAQNRAEFGEAFDLLKFVTAEEARAASRLREGLLAGIGDQLEFRHKRTKPVYLKTSPGCDLCAKGLWSCLFISGRCNCRCFYCPAEQAKIGVPTTNTLPFARVQDYVDYVEQMGFTGVSISGGEPLLTLETTLRFISAVRKRLANRVYIWLYTNGTLVTEEVLARLKDAGVDEIRFDIGATGYSLEKAAMAVGRFDHVTVEIPAIPEDYDLMTIKLREMADSGISFLNLHQLRLTPHNRPNLAQRPYTYLHDEQVTVLESELTALKLIRHASENKILLPINYCSFVYKNRFQRAGARNRCARLIKKSHEDVTESGYIRSLQVKGPPDVVGSLADALRQGGAPADLWLMPKEKDRLFFGAALWEHICFTECALFVAYFDSRLVSSVTYAHPFREIRLNRSRTVFVERTRVSEEMEIPPDRRLVFEKHLLKQEAAEVVSGTDNTIDRLFRYEAIPPELQDYGCAVPGAGDEYGL